MSWNHLGSKATTSLLKALTGLPGLRSLALSGNVFTPKESSGLELASPTSPAAGPIPLAFQATEDDGDYQENDSDPAKGGPPYASPTPSCELPYATACGSSEPPPVEVEGLDHSKGAAPRGQVMSLAPTDTADASSPVALAFCTLRNLLSHPQCALETVEMSCAAGHGIPAELPILLGHLEKCASLTNVTLGGYGGGATMKTTLALLSALQATRNSLRYLDIRNNGFGVSAYSFVVDEWRRNCPHLEKLLLFGIDPRKPFENIDKNDKMEIERAGLSVSHLGEAASLATQAAELSTRNRTLKLAAEAAGVHMRPILRSPKTDPLSSTGF